jgi:hypothetical protein
MKYHLNLDLFSMKTYSLGRMMESRGLRPKDVSAMTGLSRQRVVALVYRDTIPEQYWPLLAWALNLSRIDFAKETLACLNHPFVPAAEALRLEAESQAAAKTA